MRNRHGVIAFEDEPLRILAYRMAEKGLTRLPVMPRSGGPAIGVIELSDLLSARTRVLEAEQRRERTLGTRRATGDSGSLRRRSKAQRLNSSFLLFWWL